MLNRTLVILFIFLIQLSFLTKSHSQTFHEQYFDWTLFSNEQDNKIMCYTLAIPVTQSGNTQNRGQPYFMIVKTKEKLPEITVVSGYYYKEKSEVELSFGLRKFNLLAYKNHAWTYEIDDDIEIIKAMKRGDDIIVKAKSADNQYSSDTYSLIGFNKVYDALYDVCE